MDLKNINGQIIGWSTISDDILKYHCSTSQVVEKRHLDFKDQASLLDELSKVIDNKTLFNRIKRALEKNDAEEKKMSNKAKANEKKATVTTKVEAKASAEAKTESKPETVSKVTVVGIKNDDMANLEKSHADTVAEISAEEKKMTEAKMLQETCERVLQKATEAFNNARQELQKAKTAQKNAEKEVATFSKKIKKLNEKLGEIENKIETAKNQMVYLIAPGYSGEIPACGTFISTCEVEGVANLKVEQIPTELKPDFQDMIKAGFDSAQEYAKALKFMTLVEYYLCNDMQYKMLVSDDKIQKLISAHIDG